MEEEHTPILEKKSKQEMATVQDSEHLIKEQEHNEWQQLTPTGQLKDAILQCHTLLKDPCALAMLVENQPELIQPFLFSLLQDSQKEKKWPEINTAIMSCIASGGMFDSPTNPKDPISYLKMCSEKYKTNFVCGKQWTPDKEMVVSCKDCEKDPTAALCLSCFENGNHKGHNYRLHKSGGGVCDCGDPMAWDPNGFCKHHKGVKEDFNANEVLPEKLIHSTKESVHLLLRVICRITAEAEQNKTPLTKTSPDSLIIFYLLNFFTFLSQIGAPFKNVIAQALNLSPPFFRQNFDSKTRRMRSTSILNCLVGWHSLYPSNIQSLLKGLYFSWLSDYTYKREFLRCFAANYVDFALDEYADQGSSKDSLLELSVQLFTIEPLVLKLAKSGGILPMFNWIDKLLQLSRASDGTLNFRSRGLKDSKYWKYFVDVKYIVGNLTVSHYLVYSSVYWETILKIYSQCQGMMSHKRYVKAHIEKELPFVDSVNLEITLNKWNTHFRKGFQAQGDVAENQEIGGSPTSEIRGVFNLFRTKFCQYWTTLYQAGHLFSPSGCPTCKVRYHYDIASQPVSVHIPLHRLMARFFITAYKTWKLSPHALCSKDDILPAELPQVSFYTLLCEEPLRIRVFLAQIQAGMWVRNGYQMVIVFLLSFF